MKLLKNIIFASIFILASSLFAHAQNISEGSDFKIFPNPNKVDADTYVSLEGFKADNLLVVVYDMLGRELYSKVEVMENGGFLFTLMTDGQKLPSGIYLITAAANDKVFHQKLIVK